EWAAARENRTAFRPAVSFLGGAFQMRGRIRVGEDDRTLVNSRHSFDHPLIEGLGDGADTYNSYRLDRLNCFDEVPGRRVLVCIGFLEIKQVLARGLQQSVHIEQPDSG